MFKQVMDRVWVFDCEWVPDPLAGRLLFPEVADESDDRKVMEAMWLHGGATQEEPRPFLKMATCRVVSIAAVLREKDPRGGGAKLSLLALPRDLSDKAATAERWHRAAAQRAKDGFCSPSKTERHEENRATAG